MSKDVDELKKELVKTIRFLHGQGWAPATSSNYSFREVGAQQIWISASGIDKGRFKKKDLMLVDLEGKAVNDSRKSSAETKLHTMLYALYPEVNCILHTHSILNNVVSKAHEEKGALAFTGIELQKAIQGIRTHESTVVLPIFPNSQDMEALAAGIKSRLTSECAPGFLLSAHGLYAWGDSIAAARRHIEAFEFLISYTYHLHSYNP